MSVDYGFQNESDCLYLCKLYGYELEVLGVATADTELQNT